MARLRPPFLGVPLTLTARLALLRLALPEILPLLALCRRSLNIIVRRFVILEVPNITGMLMLRLEMAGANCIRLPVTILQALSAEFPLADLALAVVPLFLVPLLPLAAMSPIRLLSNPAMTLVVLRAVFGMASAQALLLPPASPVFLGTPMKEFALAMLMSVPERLALEALALDFPWTLPLVRAEVLPMLASPSRALLVPPPTEVARAQSRLGCRFPRRMALMTVILLLGPIIPSFRTAVVAAPRSGETLIARLRLPGLLRELTRAVLMNSPLKIMAPVLFRVSVLKVKAMLRALLRVRGANPVEVATLPLLVFPSALLALVLTRAFWSLHLAFGMSLAHPMALMTAVPFLVAILPLLLVLLVVEAPTLGGMILMARFLLARLLRCVTMPLLVLSPLNMMSPPPERAEALIENAIPIPFLALLGLKAADVAMAPFLVLPTGLLAMELTSALAMAHLWFAVRPPQEILLLMAMVPLMLTVPLLLVVLAVAALTLMGRNLIARLLLLGLLREVRIPLLRQRCLKMMVPRLLRSAVLNPNPIPRPLSDVPGANPVAVATLPFVALPKVLLALLLTRAFRSLHLAFPPRFPQEMELMTLVRPEVRSPRLLLVLLAVAALTLTGPLLIALWLTAQVLWSMAILNPMRPRSLPVE